LITTHSSGVGCCGELVEFRGGVHDQALVGGQCCEQDAFGVVDADRAVQGCR
jgi:hypothetical protein